MGLTDRYRKAIGADSFVDKNSAMYTAGQIAGTVENVALGVANPCGAGAAVGGAIRGLNAMQAVGNAWNMSDNLAAGNFKAAAFDALGLVNNLSQISRACFAAGTPLLTPDGSKPIEEFQPGDLLLSSPEDDPNGPIQPRRVEEVFTRSAPLLRLVVRGMAIRTTAEHPFYVQDKGWTAAGLLQPGDLLRSHDGRWTPLESMESTREEAAVYNLRIEEYHTYFVGTPEWGFSVWSHNTSYDSAKLGKALTDKGPARPSNLHQAAHVVPTGAFSNRLPIVREAIRDAKAALESAGIKLNSAANGFWATAGHAGTHTNKFFLKLGKMLKDAQGRGNVAETLDKIRQGVQSGTFI